MNDVAPPAGPSTKRPAPRTTPVWRMPRIRGGSHSVTTMRSVSRKGPSLVSQSKVAPALERAADVKRMATASSIQRTWVEMSSMAAHTASGGARIVSSTQIVVIRL